MNVPRLIGLAAIVLALVAVGYYFFVREAAPSIVNPLPSEGVFDGKNTSFTVEGRTVTLVSGLSQVATTPGSASLTTTRYFGNEAKGDLNGDGLEDVAFLVTEDSGGSGLFYYAVVALKTPTGFKTTNAFLIGDRIAPQSTEIHADSKELHINFAERRAGEPMTVQPSQGAVLLLKVTPEGVLNGLMQ